MITIGGIGNNAGSLMGFIVGVAILRGLTTFNIMFGQAIAKTGQASLFLMIENMSLGALLLLFMIKKPRGLIPEKQLHIPGINYKSIIMSGGNDPEEVKKRP